VRDAIIVLGAVVLTTWLNLMPSVLRHGLEFNSGYAARETTAQIIAFPLMAACAIALAARDRRPGTAATFISIPTLFNLAGIAALAVGVTMYGF
jgi:hypothetical protein